MLGSRRLRIAGVLVGVALMIGNLSVVSSTAVGWAHPGHDHGGSDSGGGGTKSGGAKGNAGKSAAGNSEGGSRSPNSSDGPNSMCPDESGRAVPCAGRRG
ncbi:MAG: hypothetical protein U0R81_04260 [Mycobacterium sp.]